MIAPLRTEPGPSISRRGLIRARMAVADALLAKPRPAVEALPGWKAWAWSLWIALVAVVFVARMALSLLR